MYRYSVFSINLQGVFFIMNKKIALTLGSLAAISFASSVSAQDRWPNWYIGLSASVPFVDNQDVTQGGAGIGEADFDNGFGATFAIGYTPNGRRQASPLRYELAYQYAKSDVNSIGGATAVGDARVDAIMFNTYYDFARGVLGVGGGGLTPYIGAGVGFAEVDFNSSTITVDNSDSAFAYQGMLGVSYAPQTLPNTVWGVGYRYFAVANDLEYGAGAGLTELEYDSHNIELNARFRF